MKRILLLCCILISLSVNNSHAESIIKNIVLTWQGNPQTSQTITWQTLNKDEARYLYYRAINAKQW